MKTKYSWIALASAVILATVLSACGTATPTTTAPQTAAPTTTSPATTQPLATTASTQGKPQYGGVLTELNQQGEPAGFDPLVVQTNFCTTLPTTQDTLLSGVWEKGPAGTGEVSWLFGYMGRSELWGGQLAESWEIPDNSTIVYHIKKGIKWMQRAPGNGREMTATDIAWSIQSEWDTPGTNFDIYFAKAQHLISATATDKYTVTLKVPPAAMGTNFMENSEREFIRNPDVTKLYGNQNDWKNMDTTGPFYITDYVRGSSITYAKNPNYWDKNPVGPGKGDQLPYISTVKHLIIPDTSTQLAGFRTGKIDLLRGVLWEDATDMMKRAPAVKSIQTMAAAAMISGRVDKQDLPFKDVKVRRALNIAVNKQELVSKYYQGKAELFAWPFYPNGESKPFYTPLDQMPASVQELYQYNPDKAKQLLKDAGYPNGFKTKIAVNASGPDSDFVQAVREYLLKVGVDLQLQVMETSVYRSVMTARSNEEMIIRGATMPTMPYMLHELRVDSSGDPSYWQDDQTLAVWQSIQDNFGRNDTVWYKAVKDVMPHVLDQAWGIFLPVPYGYHLYWPWLKNFHGEVNTGYARFHRYDRYAWIDQDLKKSMGY